MPVPSYKLLMLPLMQLVADGQEHSAREAIELLGDHLGVSEEDRREMLPSGVTLRFASRVGWARTYLTKAGLLETIGEGRFRVTPRGQQVLSSRPTAIDARFLRQFAEFREFQGRQSTTGVQADADEGPKEPPQETMEGIHLSMRRELADDLLKRIKACSPRFFEQLVVDLLVAMGYGGSRKDAGQAVGQIGDGGIDGVIKEDKLGLDNVCVQAKRWEAVVGRPIVQGFAGSLEGRRARKGVLITTSQFSAEAKDYVTRIEKAIVLIDGEQLAQYLIDHNIGVAVAATYAVKRVDLDYFSNEP
jgi:restriction system protein